MYFKFHIFFLSLLFVRSLSKSGALVCFKFKLTLADSRHSINTEGTDTWNGILIKSRLEDSRPQRFPYQLVELDKGYLRHVDQKHPSTPTTLWVPTSLCYGGCSWWKSSTFCAEVKNLYLYLKREDNVN